MGQPARRVRKARPGPIQPWLGHKAHGDTKAHKARVLKVHRAHRERKGFKAFKVRKVIGVAKGRKAIKARAHKVRKAHRELMAGRRERKVHKGCRAQGERKDTKVFKAHRAFKVAKVIKDFVGTPDH
jgi:hypothetical protein